MRAPLFVGLFVAATAFLLGACSGEEEASRGPAPSPQSSPSAPVNGPPMAFDTIEAGEQSGISAERPQLLKIETEAEWEEFWSRHRANVTPLPPPPSVDFSREMVIAAVDGQEPSGGYRFEITAIEDNGSRLIVRVNKRVPGESCIVTEVITQPFHIVRLAKSDLELDLILSEETYGCE